MAFFKQEKPKGFHFKPRVYDQQKEEFEQRVQRIKEELGMVEHVPGSSIRGSFQAARSKKRVNIFGLASSARAAGYIKIISIILIAIALYFVFQLLTATISRYQQQHMEPRERQLIEID
ncbi:MAG: hypothetical protein LBK47_06470 [Prevotellaceae bacterium]|jgi:hypothetical protein|nr:hypothetical protein [Prevotellaceae bacterium]